MSSTAASRRVFASYSRKDARVVHELVRLIRITDAPVFLDVDSIPAGDRWRTALESAISQADLMAVFWSVNASTSEEVAREYRLALDQGKPIVPVVLDDSLLPDELAQFQGIVLTDFFAPHDASFDPRPYVQEMVVRFLAHG